MRLQLSGIGVLGLSGIGVGFAPEALPAEFEGGASGATLVKLGGLVSVLGATLEGYAQNGVTGAAEHFVAGISIERSVPHILPDEIGEFAKETANATLGHVLDQVAGALIGEDKACGGE